MLGSGASCEIRKPTSFSGGRRLRERREETLQLVGHRFGRRGSAPQFPREGFILGLQRGEAEDLPSVADLESGFLEKICGFAHSERIVDTPPTPLATPFQQSGVDALAILLGLPNLELENFDSTSAKWSCEVELCFLSGP